MRCRLVLTMCVPVRVVVVVVVIVMMVEQHDGLRSGRWRRGRGKVAQVECRRFGPGEAVIEHQHLRAGQRRPQSREPAFEPECLGLSGGGSTVGGE